MSGRGSVLVGMSGGVDSSVTAALLQEAGCDVIGITMQIWHRSSTFEDPGAMQGCCTIDAVDDARRVAARLGIPYYVPNFREEFSDAVVDDFAREYRAGRTPNPCVRCNQFVRFDGLIRRADELGIEYVATGHYARVEWDSRRGEYVLLKGIDPAKDQSYMLHTLQQHHLSRMLLPLGGLPKSRTRDLARSFGLPVAEKPDSQEICFVAGKNYADFLRRYAGVEDRPGEIVDTAGAVVGRHEGVHRFTVGQRKGLGISAPDPRYVIELRPVENRVVVGDRGAALRTGLICSHLSFTGTHPETPSVSNTPPVNNPVTDPVAEGFSPFSPHQNPAPPSTHFRAAVKIRYHSPDHPAEITVEGDTATVCFDEPVWGIAPGQLAVFYDGDRVIGGGTIDCAT